MNWNPDFISMIFLLIFKQLLFNLTLLRINVIHI